MVPSQSQIDEARKIAKDLRRLAASPTISKSYDPAKKEALEIASRLEVHVRAYEIYKAMEA